MDKSQESIAFPQARGDLPFTGERYVPGVEGQLCFEHYHRYLLAMRFAANKEVLDIACGEGYGSVVLNQRARSVVGVDIAPEVTQRAQSLYGGPTLRFLTGSAQAIPLPEHSVDIAVSFETIEHVAHQAEVLAELRRVLRPSGILVMSTPNGSADDGAAHENNAFHERELSRDEFLQLLKGQFQNVVLLEQSFLYGSVIGTCDGAQRAAPELFTQKSKTDYVRSDGGIGDSYFVALAGNEALPDIGWSVLNCLMDLEKLTGDLRYAVGAMREYEARIAALEKALNESRRAEELARIQTAHMRSRLDEKRP